MHQENELSRLQRGIGIAAIFLLFISWVLPFAGSKSLLSALQPFVLQIIETPSLSGVTEILVAAGFVLLIFGSIFSLILFVYGSKRSRVRAGLLVSIVGLVLITILVFDFVRIANGMIGAVTQDASILDTFGIGFFMSWIALIVGLAATLRKRPSVSAEVIQKPHAELIQRQVPTNLVSTGYSALDNMLLGGIPAGTSVILTGPSWDEKKLIVTRFMETNLANGQGCLYISNNVDGISNLTKFGKSFQLILCHPQADTIAADYPEIIKLKTMESLTEINLEYTNALARLPKGRPAVFCLGILDDVLMDHHGATRRWLMDILGRSKSNQITTLATLNPAMHPQQEAQAVLEVFDGHIDLFEGEVQVRPKLMRIRKLAGHDFLDEELVVKREKI